MTFSPFLHDKEGISSALDRPADDDIGVKDDPKHTLCGRPSLPPQHPVQLF